MIRIQTSFRHARFVVSLLMLGSLFMASCKKDPDPVPDPVLAITSISPGAGKAGDAVVINGTAFDATPANNKVTFGTTAADVIGGSTTALTVKVPAGITGNFPITITNAKGNVTSTTQFNVTTIVTKDNVNVTGEITANTNWTASKIYLLNGFVYVRSGATLTIEPGTVIKGDKLSKGTLIIEPGAKINAQGTAAQPIIFTSNLAPGLRNLGDWGGVVICGKAPHNLATGLTNAADLPKVEGGPTTAVSALAPDPADNSGVLSYVRIEWAGVALSPNNEVNGLSLYAVGSGTKIDHIQVSYANDDSFEWFGGNVNLNYLIAYRGIDDDFDTDNGYSGNVQFGMGVRDLTIADQSGSKGFESDNEANGASTTLKLPQTSVVFSNMTLIGPTSTTLSATVAGAYVVKANAANPGASAPSANYVAGVHTRRSSALSLFNSIVMGWPAGILIDYSGTAANFASGKAVFANNIIGGNLTGTVNNVANFNRDILYISGAGAGSLTPVNALGPDSTAFGAAVGPITYFRTNNNRRLLNTDAFGLTDAFALKTNAVPATGSPALTGAAYTNAKLGAAFIDKTPTFVGAVSAEKNYTTEAWVNFDPQSVVYQ
ncbi:IPT/TIG domain-containing protein [Fibrella aquatilis]|uniref:IPT/TIG domain-containing protein n=1 Tax=Fibrella aquatilis TaxID=2817059 RepID=A0A939GAN4_9BACT|nr:IPT/TIG domain-containing protein [Fibrella aquatilis]MBO0934070.1 IPT/TIG domain-containing protein [Fibrella aquatilis]